VVRNSTFREMVRGSQPRGCQVNTPPQPLATPNPMLDSADNLQLTVNFVVGTDGRVYSALILEGVKAEQARSVLDAVRHWRFRPAVCNGAPTEAEAKVEFSTLPNRF
jgi:TonB family protein